MSIDDRRGSAPVDGIGLACFELDELVYGVEIGHVREILPKAVITPLPESPPLIEGLVDLRGVWIPVVDLGALLSGGGPPVGPRARLVVASVGEIVFAFRVDRALPVAAVAPTSLEPVPELVRSLGCRLVSAAIRRPDAKPLLLIDVDGLMARVVNETQTVEAGGVAA